MTDIEYVEHLGKVLEAYTALVASTLRETLQDQIDATELSEGLASSIFEGFGTKLQGNLAAVDAQLKAPAEAEQADPIHEGQG